MVLEKGRGSCKWFWVKIESFPSFRPLCFFTLCLMPRAQTRTELFAGMRALLNLAGGNCLFPCFCPTCFGCHAGTFHGRPLFRSASFVLWLIIRSARPVLLLLPFHMLLFILRDFFLIKSRYATDASRFFAFLCFSAGGVCPTFRVTIVLCLLIVHLFRWFAIIPRLFFTLSGVSSWRAKELACGGGSFVSAWWSSADDFA